MYLINLNFSPYRFKSNTNLQKANVFVFTIYTWVRFIQSKYSQYHHEGLGLGTVSDSLPLP